MKKTWFPRSIPALLFLICSSLALSCDWDPTVTESQTLDPVSLNALRLNSSPLFVPDPQSCQAACCDQPSCDLALVEPHQDGRWQCMLVNCWLSGQDQCVLQSSSQSKLYRRKVDPGTRTATSGPQVVPLMLDAEPKSTETKLTSDGKSVNISSQ